MLVIVWVVAILIYLGVGAVAAGIVDYLYEGEVLDEGVFSFVLFLLSWPLVVIALAPMGYFRLARLISDNLARQGRKSP